MTTTFVSSFSSSSFSSSNCDFYSLLICLWQFTVTEGDAPGDEMVAVVQRELGDTKRHHETLTKHINKFQNLLESLEKANIVRVNPTAAA